MFAAWGRIVNRYRWFVLGGSVVLLAASIVGLRYTGTFKNTTPSDLESARAINLVNQQLPQPGGSGFDLVFHSAGLSATDPSFKAAMQDALQPLRADNRVKSVTTMLDQVPNPSAYVSKDGHSALAVINVRDAFATARTYYPQLRAEVHSSTLQVYGTNFLAMNHDFDTYLQGDLHRAETVSLPLALVLLLLVFGTVVAALLPLGVGGLAVIGGLAAVGVLTRITDVSTYATNIVTLVGLGVAIDYSLFIVNRFREELRAGRSREDALAITMATSGRAITFSGITVAIGLSAMLFFQGSFLASMGFAGAVVVAIAVLYALTFLPSLLALLGPRVNRLTLPMRRSPNRRGFWHSLATWVMRHPIWVLVPVLAFMALLASPFSQIAIANGNVTQLPPQAESRKGYDLLQQFPGQGATYETVVVNFQHSSPLTSDNVGALYDYAHRLAAIPGVTGVESVFTVNPNLGRSDWQLLLTGERGKQPQAVQDYVQQAFGSHLAVLSVVTKAAPESATTRAIVSDIRQSITPPAGSQVLVAAFDIDFTDYIVQHLPLAIAFVLVVTYLVLFLLTGSVVLPLKAVIMNVLSISASFGALVFLFQQGHLSHLLNFTPAPLDPSVPVLLFCLVFGLSMDYEVLLISRIQEEYRRTGDTRHAVAEGMERSGRLITGAAAIMVAVFAAFGLADVVLIKALGLGLAIAVTMDATLVRALVVPAVMRLLGSANWWSPRPLARLAEKMNLGEAGAGAAAA
jgi:RND superfamily putative drug exporter